MVSRLVTILCLHPVAALMAVSQQPDSAARTTSHGAYTVDQARSGARIFKEICANCHTASRFRDSTFLSNWKGRSVRDLFELVRTQMPLDNPGGLRRAEYADVLAYIFELNGLPPGDSTLPSDDTGLRRIRIDK